MTVRVNRQLLATRRLRAPRRALLAPALAAALTAGGAVAPAGALTRHPTAAGHAAATALLVRRADFGGGWSAVAPPKVVPGLTCPRFHPATPRVVETGAAASPTFQASSSGPYVAGNAYVFASAAQRSAYWRAVARSGLLRCVADSLAHGSSHGVHFTVTGHRMLALPKLGVQARGYRVSGTATSEGQSLDVFLDVLVLGRGSAVSALSLSSLEQPVGRALELRLARLLGARMSSA
jgi:hypothetical protein